MTWNHVDKVYMSGVGVWIDRNIKVYSLKNMEMDSRMQNKRNHCVQYLCFKVKETRIQRVYVIFPRSHS